MILYYLLIKTCFGIYATQPLSSEQCIRNAVQVGLTETFFVKHTDNMIPYRDFDTYIHFRYRAPATIALPKK